MFCRNRLLRVHDKPRCFAIMGTLVLGSQMMHRKVCVVGAGMAGLAAARELRREGHALTVMEQSGDVGGQWLYDPRTDEADPLGTAPAPVKVHSSIYASVRILGPRECLGFSDFQFLPVAGAGRDARRFPCHREMYCYIKDFCRAFGLMDAVRLNTRVLRVAMAPQPPLDGSPLCRQWLVRSVRLDPETGEPAAAAEEEAFDAVVVANGHYSQPRLPTIKGMEEWPRRQLHSHSYREPDTFRGEVVVLVGCGDSALDLALDLFGVAREVHLSARSLEAAMTPSMSKMLTRHPELRLHPQVDRLCGDGQVVFADGTRVAADTVIYCTGYAYSFPFLDTGGVVAVEDNRVGPLFEHVFPRALAPTLSFVGIPVRVVVPWLMEAQARWVSRVLSGRSALPPQEEMLRAAAEYHRAREAAGVPARYSHDIAGVNPSEMYDFVVKYTDLPPMEEWKMELIRSVLRHGNEDREAFRDVDYDKEGSDAIHRGLQRWRAAGQLSPAAAGTEDFDAAELVKPI